MRGLRKMIRPVTTLGVAVLWTGAALAGSINGTIKYEGAVPNLRPIAMDADPGCAKKHSSAVQSEVLVLGEGNALANILVRVVKGPSVDKAHTAPSEPVVMDQNGCQYKPHVMGVMVGQTFKVLNSDGLLHNVHALSKVNKSFNMAMPATRTEAEVKFEKEEGIFKVKCDVHPWMGAYIAVMKHPYFDVTKTDGKFSISGLDPGTYTIEAWHEKLGTQTKDVTVDASGTATADFTFSPPSK